MWLSVRTPPNIASRGGPRGLPVDLLTVPLYHLPPHLADRIARSGRRRAFGDLTDVGIPLPAEGPFTRAHRSHVAPTVVDAVKTGSVQIVAGVSALDGTHVKVNDGGRVDPSVVICATGYQCGAEALVGHLDAFADAETVTPAAWPAPAGLYFHGLLSRPALLGHMARTSRPLARQIVRQLRIGRASRR